MKTTAKKLTRFMATWVLLFTFVFVSCQKEEITKETRNTTEEVTPYQDFNARETLNPYDKDMRKILGIFGKWNALPSSQNFTEDFAIFFSNEMKKLSLTTLIDTTNFSEQENPYFRKIFGVSGNTTFEIFSNMAEIEQAIMNDINLSEEAKSRLLYFSSLLKFTYKGFIEEGVKVNGNIYYGIMKVGNEKTFGPITGELTYCLRDKLGKVFVDDGNPVPEAAYVFASWPVVNFWITVADCACTLWC